MWPPDAEGMLVKTGTFILVGMTLLRFIVYEYNNLRNDLKRKKKRIRR